ncbi:PKS_ER domain-containing protein, partial [Haematococcus lacustris]
MKVAILGVGGLGHLGVQYAAALGSVVTAIDNDLSKKEEAKTLGADEFMHWNDENLASHKGAFDVILNCVSANLDTGKLLAMLRNDGTLVQLGIPGGATMTLPLQVVMEVVVEV